MDYFCHQISGTGNKALQQAFLERFSWAYLVDDSEVDHQSQICGAPLRKDGTPDFEAVFRIMELILESDAEILISNDNGGPGPGYDENRDEYCDDDTSKGHPLGANLFWDVCSPGKTINWLGPDAFAIAGYGDRKTIYKLKEDAKMLPYLCDIKITDYCERGCPECYQNSSREGKHASLDSIVRFIKKYPHVMEVAVGGGEPTLHPQFDKIVNMLSGSGIRVNFTTRNLKWFSKPTTKSFKAFAYSIDSADNIDAGRLAVIAAREMSAIGKYDQSSGALHVIAWPKDIVKMSTMDITKNDDRIKVVLLEPKHTNPASTLRCETELEEIGGESALTEAYKALLNEKNCRSLAVDTPLIKRYKDLINFDERYMREEDGELSFYYDAVEEKEYKNSYEKGVEYHVCER